MTQTLTNFQRLDAGSSTLIFRVDSGPPRLLYWGKSLDPSLDLNQLSSALERPVPHGMLDSEEPLSWLPETGQGFSDRPGIVVHRSGSDFLTQLATRSVESTDTSLTILCVTFFCEKRTSRSDTSDQNSQI